MASVNVKPTPTVSIVTVTQYSRRECLPVLARLIKKQIYTNILEWVIVDGSQNYSNALKNEEHIFSNNDIQSMPFNMKYIGYNPSLGTRPNCLSDLRNIGNEMCRGDIIVCMDDDDYYPPTRVSHAVHMLSSSSSNALIAGCSRAYIYFYQIKQLFQSKGFGEGHSTNNCLAYKREYLEHHSYQSGLSRGEEPSFTNNFTEPMIQLDPSKTIVVSGHRWNTVDKEEICRSSSRFTELSSWPITDYIPADILLTMENVFEKMLFHK